MTAPFKATISEHALSSTALLFNGTPTHIILELAQNARRAGATNIELSVTHHDNNTSTVSFHDDGPGIENPADLMIYGGSGWNLDIQATETPAGLGFFSLAAANYATACSHDWFVLLEKTHFQGEAEVIPEHSTPISGLLISFTVATNRLSTHEIRAALKFYPTPIYLAQGDERELISQTPFIEGNKGPIFENEDFRLQMVQTTVHDGGNLINFHGQVIRAATPDRISSLQKAFGAPFEVKTKLYHTSNRFLVELKNNSSLDLQLPDRKNIVANDKATEFFNTIEAIYIDYLAKHAQGGHHYPYTVYKRIADAGHDIPEAEEHYTNWLPRSADEKYDGHLELIGGGKTPLLLAADTDNLDSECPATGIALYLAIRKWSETSFAEPVNISDKYTGYSWAALPSIRLESITTTEFNGQTLTIWHEDRETTTDYIEWKDFTNHEHRSQAITITMAITHPDGKETRQPIDVDFIPNIDTDTSCEIDYHGWITADNKQPSFIELRSTMLCALFDWRDEELTWEECDNDYRTELKQAYNTIYMSEEEAIVQAIHDVLTTKTDSDLMRIHSDLRDLTISLSEGTWSVGYTPKDTDENPS